MDTPNSDKEPEPDGPRYMRRVRQAVPFVQITAAVVSIILNVLPLLHL
ncbi:hypothetical protein GCM10009836_59670 [Pseudonocardia ailaonensis]|uniref:Rhomboid family intramembrane serine protease n=1 Tax=Pseudonocardia ailaonensis TaxID=367279 RepID=A0ABN2NIV6_9PSEU